jgi:hypothetical protein
MTDVVALLKEIRRRRAQAAAVPCGARAEGVVEGRNTVELLVRRVPVSDYSA